MTEEEEELKSKRPYFTGFVSKAGTQLQINIPRRIRGKFPKDSHVRVDLIDLPEEIKTSLSEEDPDETLSGISTEIKQIQPNKEEKNGRIR